MTQCGGTSELAVNSQPANGLTWDSVEITPSTSLCFLISVDSCFIEVTLPNEIHIYILTVLTYCITADFFSYNEILPCLILGTAGRQGLQTTPIQTVTLRL